MSCLGCQRCEDGPMVTLIDGSQVCNYCEEWRVECEARHVLSIDGRDARRAYIDRVRVKRGEAAASKLADLVMTIWRSRAAP